MTNAQQEQANFNRCSLRIQQALILVAHITALGLDKLRDRKAALTRQLVNRA